MYLDLFVKFIMMIMGFWLPAVLLDAIRADSAEKAQSSREKFCVGCGFFTLLLISLL